MKRRDTKRAARADLLWAAVGFLTLQVGLAVASRTWMPELHDPYYGYKAALLRNRTAAAVTRAEGGARPLSAVMLGSSRTVYGLDAVSLEEQVGRDVGRPVVAFNFGMYGAGPATELLALRRLLAEGHRPDLVLAEVIPFYLAGQPGSPSEMNFLNPTRLWLAEVPFVRRYGRPGGETRAAWWRANLVPWYGYRFAVVSRVVPRILPPALRQDFGHCDAAGWTPVPMGRPDPEAHKAAVDLTWQAFAPSVIGFRLGGPSAAGLRDLLTLCRDERLPAALVMMPEAGEFRRRYPPAVAAEIDAYLAGLSREFAAPVVDARAWVGDEEFTDGHHLLKTGAGRFTERFAPVVAGLLAPAVAGR